VTTLGKLRALIDQIKSTATTGTTVRFVARAAITNHSGRLRLVGRRYSCSKKTTNRHPLDKLQIALQAGGLATEGRTKLQRARVWLVMKLLDGPELTTAILNHGELCGFNRTILRRASKGLVRKFHEREFGGKWAWELYPKLATEGVNDYREALVRKLMEATDG
jgi:hypothetical protein